MAAARGSSRWAFPDDREDAGRDREPRLFAEYDEGDRSPAYDLENPRHHARRPRGSLDLPGTASGSSRRTSAAVSAARDRCTRKRSWSARRAQLGRPVRWAGDRLEDLSQTSQASTNRRRRNRARRRGPHPRACGRCHRRRRRLFDLSVDRRPRARPGRQLPARALQDPVPIAARCRRLRRTRRRGALSRRRAADLHLRDGAADRHGGAARWASTRWRCAAAIWSQTDEFPYKTASGIVWDRSGFIECLDAACKRIGYDALRERQKARARGQGRCSASASPPTRN